MMLAFPLALLLLPLPMLVPLLLPARAVTTGAVRVPSSIAARMGAAHAARRRQRVVRYLPLVVWSLLVVAIAGPRRVDTLDILPASGRDIALAIDLSGSMEMEDFDLDGRRISRLDAVKQVASRFVEGRTGDRVGFVVFGDRAYVSAPLTHDTASVARAIRESVVGITGQSTAISDGLGLSLKRLRESDAKSRVVILLSDGVDTTGTVTPQDAANLARELGVRVHTIALGPDELATAPDPRNAVDVETLREIAEVSGGEMFRVRDMAELQAVTEAIDALEPSPTSAPPIKVHRDYWVWPAGAAALIALLALALGRRGET